MIIPLGLGQKFCKAPLVTLAIVLVTLAASLYQPDYKRLNSQLMALRARLQLEDKAALFFRHYCKGKLSQPLLCAEYAPLVASLYARGQETSRSRQEQGDKAAGEEGKRSFSSKPSPSQRQWLHLLQGRPGQPAYKLRRLIQGFERRHYALPGSWQQVQGYQALAVALATYRHEVAHLEASYGVLSGLNLHWRSLLKAQLQHDGLLHLFSNMILLLIFGIYAEQRLRGLHLLGVYGLGGALALFLQLFFFSDPSLILLGASGGVSVVMGLFYALFWQASLRLYIPFFSHGLAIYTPIRWSLPLLFLATELGDVVMQQKYAMGGGGVAHLAHLFGFAIGVAYGSLLRLLAPLPPGFLYKYEYKAFEALQAAPTLAAKLQCAQHILALNRDNWATRLVMIDALSRELATEVPLGAGNWLFLRQHLPIVCAQAGGQSLGRWQRELAYRSLALLPLSLGFPVYLAALPQENMLQLAEDALARDNPLLALRFFDAYLAHYGAAKEAPLVRQSVGELLSILPKDREWRHCLEAYVRLTQGSSLGGELAAWLGGESSVAQHVVAHREQGRAQHG